MELYVIKCLGQRLLPDPALQHFYAVLIAYDVRFLGAGAQGVDQLGGAPMGMHVDHGCPPWFIVQRINGSIPKVQCARLFPNHRAIYCNRHSEASTFPHLAVGLGSSIEVSGLWVRTWDAIS